MIVSWEAEQAENFYMVSNEQTAEYNWYRTECGQLNVLMKETCVKNIPDTRNA